MCSSGHAVANLRWLDRAPGAVQSPRARPRPSPRPVHSNCVSGAQLRRARGPARRHSVRPAVRALLTMTPGLARSPVLFCFLPVARSGRVPLRRGHQHHATTALTPVGLPAIGRDVSVCIGKFRNCNKGSKYRKHRRPKLGTIFSSCYSD